MHNLLATLDATKCVLDLGCGPGSFHYEIYPFQTFATDLHMPRHIPEARRARTRYFQSECATIPLAANSVDAVICHNTLEHFEGYQSTLAEIRRVLKPDGWIWVAVPNGNGLDDYLYRLIFEGGGHVNRFTFERVVSELQNTTGLGLIQTCALYSSFIFLHRPTSEEAAGYPRTARVLASMPEEFHRFGVIALNTATRVIDKMVDSRLSQYGWGFVFGPSSMHCGPLPSFFNVCRKCGSGIAESHVQSWKRTFLGLREYECPHCHELNVFVTPPSGLD